MTLAPELLTRAQALEAVGFTIVDAQAWSFVAVQSKWHWDLAMHLTTVVRVRRVQSLSQQDARDGQLAMTQAGARWDPCKIPRGFQHARALADVVIADQVEPAAATFARTQVGKGMGESRHTALVPAHGGDPVFAVPIWGRAFWPKIEHAIRVAATGRHTPAPVAGLGLAIALLVFYPSLLILGLFCCGVPPALLVVLLLLEKPPPSALAPSGPAYR